MSNEKEEGRIRILLSLKASSSAKISIVRVALPAGEEQVLSYPRLLVFML